MISVAVLKDKNSMYADLISLFMIVWSIRWLPELRNNN